MHKYKYYRVPTYTRFRVVADLPTLGAITRAAGGRRLALVLATQRRTAQRRCKKKKKKNIEHKSVPTTRQRVYYCFVFIFCHTHSTRPLRRRCRRSLYVRRTVATCLCTWADCSVRRAGTDIFPGKPWRCNSIRRCRRGSLRNRRTGSSTGCTARCRTGIGPRGKQQNLIGRRKNDFISFN